MFLGQAFPIFYAISLFGIALHYVTERITLAKFYRMPQRHGAEVTLSNVKMLTFAPLIGLAVSLWQMGNPSMFNSDNKNPKPVWNKANEKALQSFHTPSDFFRRLTSF